MNHTATWKQFGTAISSQHARTLAAYLGHRDSELALQTDSIPFPTSDDFRADSVFDPNPHQLDLPEDLLETSLLVQSLAVWGPDALIRSAFACATMQIKHQTTCRAARCSTRYCVGCRNDIYPIPNKRKPPVRETGF